jgi:hypothetical protein
MKKALLILSVVFGQTVLYGQINPIKNLQYEQSYLNPSTCPEYNCFDLYWEAPDSSFSDTLMGYNVYKNGVFYAFIDRQDLNCSDGIPDCYPDWYDNYPFWVTVKSVYNSNSFTSIANDSIKVYDIAIGIDEIKTEKHFSVLPNPILEQAILHFPQSLKNADLKVYDYLGKEVMLHKNISGTSFKFSKDKLPNGLYFLQVEDAEITLVQKVIIAENN